MAYGQIRSSSGRVMNLSPEGWINNEGENLNALNGIVGQSPPGNLLKQLVELDYASPKVQLANGVTGYRGKGVNAKNLYDAEGNLVEANFMPGEAEKDRERQKFDAEMKLAASKAKLFDAQSGAFNAKAVATPSAKPIPATALKMQQEELDEITAASGINDQSGKFLDQIDKKELTLGPVENLLSQGKNFVGMSDQNSRNFASFKATLEKMRNDSLRLNKGVQTEGDAQRAWNELVANINDPAVVKQRLTEIQTLNDRAIELRKRNVNTIRGNYGHGELDMSEYMPKGAPKASSSFDSMPNPASMKNKTIRNDETGELYFSDGKNWIRK